MSELEKYLLAFALELTFTAFSAEYILYILLQILFRKKKIIENHNIFVDLFITIILVMVTAYLYYKYPFM